MVKKKYLPILLSGLPLVAASGTLQAADRPNIVVIIADDLGTNELGCYGGKNLTTPHIDKLASEGIRLTSNYASCAMSVPIRASLYTGLYPVRSGSFQNHKATYTGTKSVTHYFSNLGYRVGRTGKNHPVNQPVVYAFENIPGFPVECTASRPPLATTDGIKEFIQRNDNQPFCLYVCSINPHQPWDAGDASKFNPNHLTLPPNCVDNAKTRSEFCKYLAEIRLLDDEVGKVMTALQETGKWDNTLVIFLGEQGPQMPFGKWTCYNYGQHSAFIARYPAKIQAGTVNNDAIVQYEDVLPTMIEFAGGAPIEGLDGKSCLGVLFGEKNEHREWAYGIHNSIPAGTAYPIRSIHNKKYKLIWNLTPQANYYITAMMNPNNAPNIWSSWLESAQTNEFAKFLTERLVRRPSLEFYDIENDPWELNNMADLPEYAEQMALMKAKLESWMKQQGDRGITMDVDNPEAPEWKSSRPIADFNDLNTIVRDDLSGNYYLESDITIPDGTEWVPIGASGQNDGSPTHFKGVLDGRGYAIKNLKINTSSDFKGLFGRLNHAIVRNLMLEVDIKGKNIVGGLSGAIFAETSIEKVCVSGSVQGIDEVGGITGRVSYDPTYTGYNTINNCYVDATVTATGNNAGGILGYTRKNTDNTYGKIEINKVYTAGKVNASSAGTATAGNAAGLLAYTEHQYVKLNNSAVLCPEITGSTPNYFYCRNIAASNLDQLQNLFTQEGINLTYKNNSDKGNGAEIDMTGKILSPSVFSTEDFYVNTLGWDFEETWQMKAGKKYPVFLGDTRIFNSIASPYLDKKNYDILIFGDGITITPFETLSLNIYNLTGQTVYNRGKINSSLRVPLEKGIYIVKTIGKGTMNALKIAVR